MYQSPTSESDNDTFSMHVQVNSNDEKDAILESFCQSPISGSRINDYYVYVMERLLNSEIIQKDISEKLDKIINILEKKV